MSLRTDLIELLQLAEGGISEYDGVHSQADQETDRALVKRIRDAFFPFQGGSTNLLARELHQLEHRIGYK